MRRRGLTRRELDALSDRIEEHNLQPVRAACGHFTTMVWRASGDCFACHVAALWQEKRAAAIRAEDARQREADKRRASAG